MAKTMIELLKRNTFEELFNDMFEALIVDGGISEQVDALMIQLELSRQRNEHLVKEAVVYEKRILSLNELAEAHSIRITNEKEIAEAKVYDLLDRIEGLKKSNKNLQDNLFASGTAYEKCLHDKEVAEAEAYSLRQEVGETRKENVALQTTVYKLQDKIDKIVEREAKWIDTNTFLEDINSALRAEVKTQTDAYHTQLAYRATEREQRNEAEEEVATLQARLERVEEENHDFRKVLAK